MRRIECSGIAATLALGACFSESSQSICDEPSCESTTGGVESSGLVTTTPDPVTSTNPSTDPTADPSATSSDSGSESSSGATVGGDDSITGNVDDSTSSSGGPTPFCGDGDVADDEHCDDMNDDPFDGCDACQAAPTLQWQYTADHEAGDDEITSLARDGDAVLVGGMVTSVVSGIDGLWMRLDEGAITPPGWFHVADLPGSNRLWDIARNTDVCAIAGVIETGERTPLASANVVTCADGNPGMGLAIAAAEAPGPEDLRSMLLGADNGLVVGGWRMHGGAPRGWIAHFDPTGQNVVSVDWLDNPGLFGDESRVHSLWAANGELFAAGTMLQGGVNHGFVGELSLLPTEPIPFGAGADASEAVAVVADDEAIIVAGWTTDLADRSALVESFPLLGGPPITWTLDLDLDDRALAIALLPEGVAVTGFTASAADDRDLFVVWLDDALVEQARVIFDGPDHGSDVGRTIVSDGDDVIVGGHLTDGETTDLLVQRWSPPA